jgi:hypothetical protein
VERIPAFAAPTFTHFAAFEDYMFSPESTEIIAHGQTGVATADDYRLNLLVHNASRSRREFNLFFSGHFVFDRHEVAIAPGTRQLVKLISDRLAPQSIGDFIDYVLRQGRYFELLRHSCGVEHNLAVLHKFNIFVRAQPC